MKNKWTLKQSPATGALWIETADGHTVCDLFHRTPHAPTGIKRYPDARAHGEAIVAAMSDGLALELLNTLRAVLTELWQETGVQPDGKVSGANAVELPAYREGRALLRRLEATV